ncbi:thioredoxin domain-containing protein 12-like [Bradysia coprophila]|uniref:thioredoxin domain-containing protein 12-like n=1 Tax=Bradysia coprophila TaxID=38358 RepID=UPI00187D9855|nr:thioredoxin domain-containing protein 12-like [Bradysia coprophila]
MFSNKISKLFLSNLNSFAMIINVNLSSRNFGSFAFAKNLDEGLKVAKSESKPVMLIVHKAFCGACRILIPKLAASDEIKKLSDNFVMVNAYNGEDPNSNDYAPDGAYVPRIVFIRSDGVTLTQVKNASIKGDENKYYYQTSEDVAKSMKLAMQLNNKVKSNLSVPILKIE